MAKKAETKKKDQPIEGEVVTETPTTDTPDEPSTVDDTTTTEAEQGEIVDPDEIKKIEENARKLESALVAHPGMEVVPGVTTDQLRNALGSQTEQRVLIKEFIKHHLVPDVDFGHIHVVKNCANQYSCVNRYHFGKDMLFKPGQEKIFSLFGITSVLERDEETYKMLPETKNLVAYKCLAKRGDNVVAEGRGAAVLGDKGRDVNSTIKIAEKRARMDACLALGFSEYFSQDLDDPDYAGQRDQANQRAAAELAAKHPEEMPEPPKPKLPGDDLKPRPAMELASQEEKAELYKAFLKAGLDKEEQLEVLAVNGITVPAEMTSGMARGMIQKLNDNAFKRPEPAPSTDVVIEDISDEPVNFDDLPGEDATPPAAPATTAKPVEMPPLDIDEDVKTYIGENLATIGLNARGLMWFKRVVTGKPFGDPQQWSDEQWRKAYETIEGILDCKIEVDPTHITDPQEMEQSEVEKVAAMFPGAEILHTTSISDTKAASQPAAVNTDEPPAAVPFLNDEPTDPRPPTDGDPRDI